MNPFATIIPFVVLLTLTFLCFYIPFKNGKRKTGYLVGTILSLLVIFTFIGNLDFLVIFIWPIIVMFQIVFIVYWSLKVFNKKKLGKIIAAVLTIAFFLVIMQPWISDWMFDKDDVIKILSFHKFELKDDFKIVENEAGGFRDYYQTFTLKLSNNDFNQISKKIRTSKNYKGYFNNDLNVLFTDHKLNDTIDFETENSYEREYWSSRSMENSTFHFTFQLDKKSKELSYIGSDE